MNEPSSFVSGDVNNRCRNTELNFPPYAPGTILSFVFGVILLFMYVFIY